MTFNHIHTIQGGPKSSKYLFIWVKLLIVGKKAISNAEDTVKTEFCLARVFHFIPEQPIRENQCEK